MKSLGYKLSWPNLGIIPALSWADWLRQQALDRLANVSAEILTRYEHKSAGLLLHEAAR